MKIGHILKRMRRQKDLTQEELAEVLNVSPQAISRWENDAALPDVTLLPGLADLFGVTLDELLDRDNGRREKQIWELCSQSQAARGKGDLRTSEYILRDGLQRFPDESCICSELALTLTLLGSEIHLEEAIRLAQRVLCSTEDPKLRATTTANLVLLYRRAGRKTEASALAKTMPHVYESREWNQALAAGTEQALKEMLIFLLTAMAECIAQWEEPALMLAQGLSAPLPSWQESLQQIERYIRR